MPGIAEVLGSKKILKKKICSRLDLIEMSKEGITKEAINNLAGYLSVSITQLAKLLPVSERTILRYTSKKPFNRMVSEQIIQIAEVVARGTEVFRDKDKFTSWMHSPSKALGNQTPLSLLSSRFGTEMVLDELGRIEYGVYS
jgi:putative toxin-antitoxin system antitoxin component (TIGR02293 family)